MIPPGLVANSTQIRKRDAWYELTKLPYWAARREGEAAILGCIQACHSFLQRPLGGPAAVGALAAIPAIVARLLANPEIANSLAVSAGYRAIAFRALELIEGAPGETRRVGLLLPLSVQSPVPSRPLTPAVRNRLAEVLDAEPKEAFVTGKAGGLDS